MTEPTLEGREERRTITLLIGPQHPSSGHMRFIVELDGDVMVNVTPDIGYVHRSAEKLSERKLYVQVIPVLERPMLIDAIHANLAYVMALESLLGVEPPERALYLRTVAAELNRIASHLYGIGILGIMLGSSTPYMWAFHDRELFLELLQDLSGARVTYSYVIPGGVRRDLPQGFEDKVEKAFRYLEAKLPDWEALFIKNPVVLNRTVDVGKISKEDAKRLGLVGPNLRASGVKYDVRKAEPYAAYPELDFEIVSREEGDSCARLLVRIEEIKMSMRIVRQALKKIPSGPVMSERFAKYLRGPKAVALKKGIVRLPVQFISLAPPEGEAFSRVEASRGELCVYLVSDGSLRPYRVRFVTPSLRNVIAFSHAARGHRLADLFAIYGSLDYFPPEADR